MVTKKIFKVVENNFYTGGYCKKLYQELQDHINKNQNNMLAKDINLFLKYDLISLVYSAITEGKIEVDIDELKRRTTTKDFCEMFDEFKMVAKLSNKYQKNKDKYIEV